MPYSSIFLYKVVKPIFNKREASVLFPLVALSLLVTFLYGSLVWNMFPQFASSTTSWEGHLGGAAAGIAATILFRHKGPQQPELFIDEEEEDNRSYPEDEEVITNPDQEKKE